MSPIERMQFRYRLTGADFHPRHRTWLVPVVVAALVVAGMCAGWM
ncbi:hypothetical protein [Pantoea agglomerans]|nr:hypothetical protein [Pantoea agglomerans]